MYSIPYSDAYTEIPLLGLIFARGWEGEDLVEAAPAQWGPSDPGAVQGAAVTRPDGPLCWAESFGCLCHLE